MRMLQNFKELSLKEKIIYTIYAFATILIAVICILYFFKVLDFDLLILCSGTLLVFLCVLNLFNNPPKENKKNFVVNLIYIAIILIIIIFTLLV